MTAKQVGIDINLYKARRILEDLSIPIDSAILQLATEGGAQLRKKRFSGDYSDMNVETDSTGFIDLSRNRLAWLQKVLSKVLNPMDSRRSHICTRTNKNGPKLTSIFQFRRGSTLRKR